MVRADVPSKVLFLLAVVAPTLLPSKLDIKVNVVSYNP